MGDGVAGGKEMEDRSVCRLTHDMVVPFPLKSIQQESASRPSWAFNVNITYMYLYTKRHCVTHGRI